MDARLDVNGNLTVSICRLEELASLVPKDNRRAIGAEGIEVASKTGVLSSQVANGNGTRYVLDLDLSLGPELDRLDICRTKPNLVKGQLGKLGIIIGANAIIQLLTYGRYIVQNYAGEGRELKITYTA